MKLQGSTGNDTEFILPDEGTYVMEFTTCQDAGLSTYPNQNTGEFDARFKAGWTIREEDSEFNGIEVVDWFNQRTFSYCDQEKNKQSKFYPFLKAMLGRHYDPDQDEDEDGEFDMDVLLGSHINVTIQHVQKKTGTFAKPVGASPIRKKKPAPAPAKKAAKPVEPEEDDGDELFDDEEIA